MTFTATDVLLKAASRVEEAGKWCQKTMWNGEAGCAIGTLLNIGLELDTNIDDAIQRLGCVVGIEDIGEAEAVTAVTRWNDRPGRTAHEVAEAMRRAAS